MKIKLENLDGRHNASHIFSSRAWVLPDGGNARLNFINIREWCWETFGPGVERDLIPLTFVPGQASPYKWAFHYDPYRNSCYIYLKRELLTAFLLKWS
jgi:hypothetical protein